MEIDHVPPQDTKGYGDDHGVGFVAVGFVLLVGGVHDDGLVGGSPFNVFNHLSKADRLGIAEERLSGPVDYLVVSALHVEIALRDEVTEMLGRGFLDASTDPEFDFTYGLRSPASLVRGDEGVVRDEFMDELLDRTIGRIRIFLVEPLAVIRKLICDLLRLEL